MEREALPAGSGMLFDFPPGATPAIWMRNMRISLDLLFVDGQAAIQRIFHSVPPCEELPCEIYQEQHPLRFVIELPAGTADRLGLQVGDVLDLGGRERTPAPSRSEEHTSELQSRENIVCRLLLEKKKVN